MSDDREAKVRERAYQIWEEEGSPDGRDQEHWAQAEKEIEAEAKTNGATAPSKA